MQDQLLQKKILEEVAKLGLSHRSQLPSMYLFFALNDIPCKTHPTEFEWNSSAYQAVQQRDKLKYTIDKIESNLNLLVIEGLITGAMPQATSHAGLAFGCITNKGIERLGELRNKTRPLPVRVTLGLVNVFLGQASKYIAKLAWAAFLYLLGLFTPHELLSGISLSKVLSYIITAFKGAQTL